MEIIIYSLLIAFCGFAIGNILGYRDGLAKGRQIVEEAYNL